MTRAKRAGALPKEAFGQHLAKAEDLPVFYPHCGLSLSLRSDSLGRWPLYAAGRDRAFESSETDWGARNTGAPPVARARLAAHLDPGPARWPLRVAFW